MKNNIQLYQIAKTYLGTKGSEPRKYCGLPSSAAWCCAFVSFIFYKGDDAKLWYGGKKVVYCPSAMTWCRANLAEIPIYLAMPMDVIFFDWNINGTADHIGFVRERKTDQSVYTIEGNTDGGKVALKTRPVKYVAGVFRPHFTGTYTIKKLDIDGQFGYNSIAMLRKALGLSPSSILDKATVKALQKKVGVAQDGSWGTKTSKAVQKLIGVKQDGYFGEKSVKALQKWINSTVYPSTQEKVCNKAKSLVKGGFKYVYYKDNKGYPKNGGNCIRFVACCLEGGGIDVSTKQDGLLTDGFAEKLIGNPKALELWKARNGANWTIVTTSKTAMPTSSLKPGDVLICYNGKDYKHTALYIGGGQIADCNPSKGAKIRAYSDLNYPCKIAFRYTK